VQPGPARGEQPLRAREGTARVLDLPVRLALQALLGRLVRLLWRRSEPSGEGSRGGAARVSLMNGLRMVARLMPLLLEDPADAGIRHLLWTDLAASPVEGIDQPPAGAAAAAPSALPAEAPPLNLGGCLVLALVRSLFVPGFTLLACEEVVPRRPQHATLRPLLSTRPSCVYQEQRFSPAAWDASSAATDEAREAAMRAAPRPLLRLRHETPSMTRPGHAQARAPRLLLRLPLPLAAAARRGGLGRRPEPRPARGGQRAAAARQSALPRAALGPLSAQPGPGLAARLATHSSPPPSGSQVIFSYDPVGYGIPYAHSLLPDSHRGVVHAASQLLMVLLSPRTPAAFAREGGGEGGCAGGCAGGGGGGGGGAAAVGEGRDDGISRLLVGLQRPETLAFLVAGFRRLLRNGFASRGTYLPSAQAALQCQQELLLLLHCFLERNAAFRLALLQRQEDLAEVVLCLVYWVVLWSGDGAVAHHSWVHLSLLSLLLLSAEPGFSSIVNLPCPVALPLPGSRPTGPSIADLLFSSVAELVSAGKERLEPLLPAALALLANLAPHTKMLSDEAAALLTAMLLDLAQPSYLFGGEARPELLITALAVVSSSLLYHHAANLPLLHALLHAAAPLRALPSLQPPPPAEAEEPLEPDGTRGEGAGPASSDAAGEADGGDTGGGNADAAAAEPFAATAAWVEGWKARLPLQAIFLFLDAVEPKARTAGARAAGTASAREVCGGGCAPPP